LYSTFFLETFFLFYGFEKWKIFDQHFWINNYDLNYYLIFKKLNLKYFQQDTFDVVCITLDGKFAKKIKTKNASMYKFAMII